MTTTDEIVRKVVLVVHQEAAALARAVRLLPAAEYEVLTASSAGEARRRMEAVSPDLLVVDAQVANVDEVLLARDFHGQGTNRLPGLVFLRGNGTAEQLTRGYRAGALCHVLRDEGFDRLPDIVETALERLDFQRELD